MRRKRRKERDAVVDRLHRLLKQGSIDEMLQATSEAVERFPRDAEVRILHGTALTFSRDPPPQDAAWEVGTAVSFDKNDPWLVVRAANLLFYLGEHDAVRDYLNHAESLPDENGDLVGEIAYLRHRLDQVGT